MILKRRSLVTFLLKKSSGLRRSENVGKILRKRIKKQVFLRFSETSRRIVSVTTKVLISGIKNVKSVTSIYFKAEDADDVIEVRDEPGVV